MGIVGISLIVVALIWSIVFPLNKSLWTSSFVLYTSGLAILSLTLFYYVIDIANYKKWTKLFLIWGVNPMIVFFFSEIIPQGLEMIQFQNPEISSKQINLQNYLYEFWIAPIFNNPMTASLAGALIYVTIWSFILGLFYKHKIIFTV